AFKKRMLENRIDIVSAESSALENLGSSAEYIAGITEMSAEEIKDAAEDWNIALQTGSKGITDFVHKMNEDFKGMTEAMWQDVINTAVFNSWRDNPFARQVAKDEAQGQGLAANQALWEYLESGGTLDPTDIMGNQLMAAGIDAALNEGLALGLTDLALEDFLFNAMMNMGLGASQQGFNIAGSTFSPLYAMARSRIGQTKTNFEESAEYKQLGQMGALIGEGPESDAFKERIDRIWTGGNAAAELEQMNTVLHSEAARSLGHLKDEAGLTAEAFAALRASMWAGDLPLDEPIEERDATEDAEVSVNAGFGADRTGGRAFSAAGGGSSGNSSRVPHRQSSGGGSSGNSSRVPNRTK
ncbi:uncharacterized protein METZ01_LOCUS321926, partial [marine metagenome]